LYFEAFKPKDFDYKTLKSKAATVLETVWAGWTPIVRHEELQSRIWYSNDNDFIREIPVFKEKDRYVLRWRGQIKPTENGDHTFQTRSDDGSLLYIDGQLIVDNDGLHGGQTKSGTASLVSGQFHDITIAFFGTPPPLFLVLLLSFTLDFCVV